MKWRITAVASGKTVAQMCVDNADALSAMLDLVITPPGVKFCIAYVEEASPNHYTVIGLDPAASGADHCEYNVRAVDVAKAATDPTSEVAAYEDHDPLRNPTDAERVQAMIQVRADKAIDRDREKQVAAPPPGGPRHRWAWEGEAT